MGDTAPSVADAKEQADSLQAPEAAKAVGAAFEAKAPAIGADTCTATSVAAAKEDEDSLETAEAAKAAGEAVEAAAAATLLSAASSDIVQGKWGAHFLCHVKVQPEATVSKPFPAAVFVKPGLSPDEVATGAVAVPGTMMPNMQDEPWSKLQGHIGCIWRFRNDWVGFLAVKKDFNQHGRGEGFIGPAGRCIQTAAPQLLVYEHLEQRTVILMMPIAHPKGWVPVAMRGSENYGFLEIDEDVEREDRTDEGNGLPGKAFDFASSQMSKRQPWTPPVLGTRIDACAAKGHDLCSWKTSSTRNAGCNSCGCALVRQACFQCNSCLTLICNICRFEAEEPLPTNLVADVDSHSRADLLVSAVAFTSDDVDILVDAAAAAAEVEMKEKLATSASLKRVPMPQVSNLTTSAQPSSTAMAHLTAGNYSICSDVKKRRLALLAAPPSALEKQPALRTIANPVLQPASTVGQPVAFPLTHLPARTSSSSSVQCLICDCAAACVG